MSPTTTPAGADPIVVVDGVEMYRITDVDAMDPFLMTVVSSSDLWMFLSSTGGLTAGRREPADAIFPYETDDRLHHVAGRVGPVTLLTVQDGAAATVWEPFAPGAPDTVRTLMKSLRGDAVVVQARHAGLGLTVRARWAPSDRFGWVRTVTVVDDRAGGDATARSVTVVDGLLDVMPWGIGVTLQQQRSNLANAYRRSEITDHGVGVHSLEAQIVDRPEPAEALRATTVWTAGLEDPELSVDPATAERARRGEGAAAVRLRTGRPGSFLLRTTLQLDPGATRRWHVIADVAQSQADVAALHRLITASDDPTGLVDADIRDSSDALARIVGTADATHRTASRVVDAHDLSNTLFNVMRGGTFLDGPAVDTAAFRAFVGRRNRATAARHAGWLEGLPDRLDVADLTDRAVAVGDPDLVRLARSYLPLTFSRRHGDPSRPWNHFSIRVRDEHGAPLLGYQGNWRDIFQNWEALCRSHPSYLPSVVATFLNASTVDGYNPYRITDDGVDWEVLDPEDPWSGIGYWGDHQIVYLHRLLLATEAHHPGWLAGQLEDRTHSFADVPYRIAGFDALLADPKDTIAFDDDVAAAVQDRVDRLGGDGRLLADDTGAVVHVSLLEKLLVPALAKLSNLVPRGGIWMNTQRPEWNDANNALVGWGLSMVTLAHLRPYMALLGGLVDDADGVAVSDTVLDWTQAVTTVLEDAADRLADTGTMDPPDRLDVLTRLGRAAEAHRRRVYREGPGDGRPLDADLLARLSRAALTVLDDSLDTARRPDGLFHSYNLLRLSADGTAAHVEHLQEMLEGQVAAISSGRLDTAEVVALVTAMYGSALYRPDVDSFMLYPARTRPAFLARNLVPADRVAANPLLTALAHSDAASARRVLTRDVDGQHRFGADLANVGDLDEALAALAGSDLGPLVDDHAPAVRALFEEVFAHHAFTGRSSTMYAYEGLGSVYWHMVAKLLVALQEHLLDAATTAPAADRAALTDLYRRVRQGLGFNRTAAEYGAFPTDAYSHTPAHAGAQQPGMTGQVKEELLTRWAELGLTVAGGRLVLTDALLDPLELLPAPAELTWVDVDGRPQRLQVPAGALGLTLCQVPVVVRRGDTDGIEVVMADGSSRTVEGRTLDLATSQQVLQRRGGVARLVVTLSTGQG